MFIPHPQRHCTKCNITERIFIRKYSGRKLRWRSNPMNREEWFCNSCATKEQGLGKKCKKTQERRKSFEDAYEKHKIWLNKEYGDSISSKEEIYEPSFDENSSNDEESIDLNESFSSANLSSDQVNEDNTNDKAQEEFNKDIITCTLNPEKQKNNIRRESLKFDSPNRKRKTSDYMIIDPMHVLTVIRNQKRIRQKPVRFIP
jgi:hypothetical protein